MYASKECKVLKKKKEDIVPFYKKNFYAFFFRLFGRSESYKPHDNLKQRKSTKSTHAGTLSHTRPQLMWSPGFD